MPEDQALSGRAYLRLVGLGVLIGIPAAVVAALFLALVHEVEGWLWDDIPDALDRSSPPWFLVVGLPVVGAAIVAVARRFLPGDGGHRPLQGIRGGPTPVSHVPGVVLAALGSLAFGAVVGPEAPVIAVGSAVGMAGSRLGRLEDRGTAILAQAGAFAAVSALFGGPAVAGVLMVEGGAAALGPALIPALLPGFVAAAVGYVVFVGFGSFGGLDVPGLTVPNLPAYDGTRFVDLALAVAVGVLTALLAAGARALARRVEGLAPRVGMVRLLLAGGLVVGLLALAADALGDDPQDVLFSGQAAVPALVAEGSTALLLVLLVAKVLAYGVSMGSGFRGGPIFPAVFLGIGVATLAVVWFDASPTWAVAVGTAAGMAAQAQLLVSALVFGILLVGTAGVDAAPAAVLAAAAAWITTTSRARGDGDGGGDDGGDDPSPAAGPAPAT